MLAAPDPDEASLRRVAPAAAWTRRLIILLTILSATVLAVAIVWGASHLAGTLLILVVAALVAYAIVPIVELFHRIMPRALAILLAYLLVFIALGAILYAVMNTAFVQVQIILHSIATWLSPDRSGRSPLVTLLRDAGLSSGQINALEQQVASTLSGLGGSLVGGLAPLLGGIASGLLNILLTVVISIYLLVDGGRLVAWLRRATPRSRRGQIGSAIDVLQHVVGGYIRGQVLLCAVTGFLVGAGLFLIGFPFAAMMGVMTFVTEFIPVLGTIFAGGVAVLLALTQGWTMTIVVLIFFILIHLLEGYVLAPRLVGRAVELNPAIMLIALTAGAELFGPFGAIFAAPTAGLLQALSIALWVQYRKTHAQEFPDAEQGRDPKQPEKFMR